VAAILAGEIGCAEAILAEEIVSVSAMAAQSWSLQNTQAKFMSDSFKIDSKHEKCRTLYQHVNAWVGSPEDLFSQQELGQRAGSMVTR